jgi:hypothetical protein
MAAALGRDLILDEYGGNTGALIGAHHAGHVRRAAIARIGIGEQGDVGAVAQPGVHLGHLGQAELAHIRLADERGGGAIAAAGGRLEAGPLGQFQRQGVVGAGQMQDFRRLDQLAKTCGAAHGESLDQDRISLNQTDPILV